MKARLSGLMVVQLWKGVGWVARLAYQVRPRLAVTGGARALAAGALPVALSVATARAVEASVGVRMEGIDSDAAQRLVDAMWLFLGIFAVQVAVSTVAGAHTQVVGRHVDGALRERVMRAALRPVGVQALEDATMRRAFDAARSMGMGAGYTAGAAAGTLPSIVAERVRLIGYIVGLTYLSWPVGLALAVMTIVNQNEMLKAMARVLTITALFGAPPSAKYHFDLGARPSAAKEVRVFGLEDWVRERYRHSILGFYRGAWELRREFTPGLIIVLAVNAAATAAAVAAVGFAALRGDFGVAGLAFGLAAVMALTPRFNLDDVLLTIAAGVIEAIRKAETLAASTEVDDPAAGGAATALPKSSIRFEDVAFAYPGADAPVLSGLNLELRAGERTALVGPNGAGKTTLVKLLCRLYEPTAGRITVDGQDVRTFSADSWRRQLAVLFQDYVQYELSAADNVRYGAVDAATTPERLEEAARRAGAAFVGEFSAGWDTPLSPRFEGGVGLSGGQWQRIGLARALYALDAGARVLVLDEPTASLDVRGEATIYNDFLDLTSAAEASSPLTTLLISHRFSTVRQADRIVLLEDGHITEDGDHDELMEIGGRYAAMFNAQAARFSATSDLVPEESA